MWFVITLGNGYQYQLFADSQESALQQARSRAPSGVSVGGTDLSQATANSVGNTPQQGVPDLNRNYPGSAGFGGGTTGVVGGGGGGGGNYDVPGNDPGYLTDEDPFAAYVRGLQLAGRPSTESTIAGRYARRQMNPYLYTSRFKELLSGEPAQPFEQYTKDRNLGDVRQEAGNLFNAARGRPQVGDINLGEPDEDQANMINQLVMAALGKTVSPLTQRMFGLGGSLRNSRSDFLADREQGAGQNYLDYVRNRLGLQMFGI